MLKPSPFNWFLKTAFDQSSFSSFECVTCIDWVEESGMDTSTVALFDLRQEDLREKLKRAQTVSPNPDSSQHTQRNLTTTNTANTRVQKQALPSEIGKVSGRVGRPQTPARPNTPSMATLSLSRAVPAKIAKTLQRSSSKDFEAAWALPVCSSLQ